MGTIKLRIQFLIGKLRRIFFMALPENEKDYQNILRNITGYLNQDGYMIVKFANEQNICWIKTNYNNVVETESDTEDGHWLFWKMERQN